MKNVLIFDNSSILHKFNVILSNLNYRLKLKSLILLKKIYFIGCHNVTNTLSSIVAPNVNSSILLYVT